MESLTGKMAQLSNGAMAVKRGTLMVNSIEKEDRQ
jgi:hypothetical protein